MKGCGCFRSSMADGRIRGRKDFPCWGLVRRLYSYSHQNQPDKIIRGSMHISREFIIGLQSKLVTKHPQETSMGSIPIRYVTTLVQGSRDGLLEYLMARLRVKEAETLNREQTISTTGPVDNFEVPLWHGPSKTRLQGFMGHQVAKRQNPITALTLTHGLAPVLE